MKKVILLTLVFYTCVFAAVIPQKEGEISQEEIEPTTTKILEKDSLSEEVNPESISFKIGEGHQGRLLIFPLVFPLDVPGFFNSVIPNKDFGLSNALTRLTAATTTLQNAIATNFG